MGADIRLFQSVHSGYSPFQFPSVWILTFSALVVHKVSPEASLSSPMASPAPANHLGGTVVLFLTDLVIESRGVVAIGDLQVEDIICLAAGPHYETSQAGWRGAMGSSPVT